jgi:hypothetical protein
MDEMKEIKPNLMGLALAKALRGGRGALNYPGKLPESVPLLGGMGAGDLLFGKSPEAMEDYSYGFGPLGHGKGLTTKLDPRMVDVVTAPVIGIGGAAQQMGKRLTTVALDAGKRQTLKKIGSVAATAAIPVATLKSAEHMLPAVGEKIAQRLSKATFKAASPSELIQAATKWVDSPRLGHYLDEARELGLDYHTGDSIADTVRNALAHPEMPKVLEDLTKGRPISKDFITRHMEDRQLKNPDAPVISDKALDAVERATNKLNELNDRKLWKMAEDWAFTGIKPSGAPAWLGDVNMGYVIRGIDGVDELASILTREGMKARDNVFGKLVGE